MIDEKVIIALLKTKQLEHARDAISKPRDNSLFEYGRIVGINTGLMLAERLISDLHEETENKGLSFN